MKTPAIIIALGLIASSALGSYAYYQGRVLSAKAADTLEVTGSARQEITSDMVHWTAGWSRDVTLATVKAGYASMADDQKAVVAFYAGKGVAEKDLDISPVMLQQDYSYSQNDPNAPKRYTLQQTIEMRSNDVQGVTALSKATQPLIDQGVLFATQSLEYTYSKLADLRVSMLADAVKDAKARAASIAGADNVGAMRSASVGVVQVLPVGSTDVSDYGAYDTSKIEKDVMVTVRASFATK